MKVKYKFDNNLSDELVCELTRFMDKYLLRKTTTGYFCTYLYNDLDRYINENAYRIAFRYPGATRGSIKLKRINQNKFKIVDIYFIEETSFEEFGCYNKTLRKKIKKFIGKTLDFSDVKLNNNTTLEVI